MKWFQRRATRYKRVVYYRCETCYALYSQEAEAAACAALGFPALFQPGDIVVDVRSEGFGMDQYTRKGIFNHPKSKYRIEPFCAFYGVYPDDDPWIYKTGSWLHDQPGIAPYFVVAAVTSRFEAGINVCPKDRHVPCYHLFSEAGCSPGHSIKGYTGENHICMKKPAIPPPQIVIDQSKKYIGQYTRELLRGA